ncbi:MAG: hypothetical protein GF311_02765 [Candidatus Lokiarchaeota archaeon]|nr:hypothetical protein [Candidatus Lokiarchaeota archaeon]
MTFEELGPLLKEERTIATCHICSNYIYKQTYYDENSKDKKKTVFVCKNCLEQKEK